MTRAACAALLLVVLSACSFGGSAQKPAAAPSRAAAVSWLRHLDAAGVDFTVKTSIAGGPLGALFASGHLKQGELALTTTRSVDVVVYDGVVYGKRAGSSSWLEMSAAQLNFLWPAARLSLVWAAILLSPDTRSPYRLARDQARELSGGMQVGTGVVYLASQRLFEVSLAGSNSTFIPRGADPAAVVPPASATPGNVLSLFAPGVAA